VQVADWKLQQINRTVGIDTAESWRGMSAGEDKSMSTIRVNSSLQHRTC